MIKLLKALKKNLSIKINIIFLVFSLFLKLWFTLSNVFVEYLDIIDFINWRLFFVLCILVLLQILLNLPFVKDLQQEISIFNEGPANKSFFIAYLRKYHLALLLSAYLWYFLAVSYFVEEPFISYLLGLIAFINLILYLVQFVVYTNDYVRKSFTSNKSSFNRDKREGSTRNMVTSSTIKKMATVCYEFTKGAIALGGGLEVVLKLSHGGMNDVSPWRQEWLNQTFPNDKTKIWTESKASMAMHNRAMGNPHGEIYDSVGDKIMKGLPKEK
jgi:hypothetical protein